MKVYSNLAPIYDYFIDWKDRIRREDPFFQHLFQERLATSILDVACGTGGHSLHWAEMGYNVVGVDSAPNMIEYARQKANEEELDVEFQCYPMTDFSSRLHQKFDAIVCLGNNIPHLLEVEHVQKLFQEAAASMKETGVAIFHVINFYRILEHKKRDFPAKSHVAGDVEYLFLRNYEFASPHLDFHFITAVKENGEWSSKSYQLKHHPWKQEDLIPLAKEAGFTEIMCYGDYSFSDFDPEKSADLIMVCELGDVD
ncbi:MAG: class I SAM-dependent methyltransferase [Candidatus Hinthialibacter sp.]